MLDDRIKMIIDDLEAGKQDSIIPVLQKVQEIAGYIPQEAVFEVARKLETTPARIFGVVTFYNQFKLNAPGKHIIRVCRGTACHVKGSAKILDLLCKHLGVKSGETTKDGFFTIEEVACLGSCSIAPAIMIDDKFYGHMTPNGILQLVDALKGGAKK